MSQENREVTFLMKCEIWVDLIRTKERVSRVEKVSIKGKRDGRVIPGNVL